MKIAKYFSAPWCEPCKLFKPIMEELSLQGYNIKFINGDENKKEAIKYNIRSIPTVVIEQDGKEINRLLGVQSKEMIIKELS